MNRFDLYVFFLFSCCFLYSCSGEHTNSSEKRQTFSKYAPVRELIALDNTATNYLTDTAAIDNQIQHADTLWKRNADSAKTLLTNAAIEARTINYYAGVVSALHILALKHAFQSNIYASIYYCKLALPFAKILPSEDGILPYNYALMSVGYYSLGKSDSAFLLLYESLKQLELYSIKGLKGYNSAYVVYTTAGALWFNEGDMQSATPYFNKARTIALLLRDSVRLMEVVHNTATIYFNRQVWDSALLLYHTVINSRYASSTIKTQAKDNVATLFMHPENSKSNPDSAIFYATMALNDNNKAPGEVNHLYTISGAYLAKSNKENDRRYYKMAENILNSIEKKKTGTSLGERKLSYLYKALASFAADKKAYKKAFELTSKALDISDSLSKKERLELRGKMDARYRIAEKDKQIAQKQLQVAQAEREAERKNTLLLGVAFVSTIIIMLLSWRYLYVRHRHAKLESNMDKEKLKAKIEGEEKERGRIAHDLHDSVNSRLAACQSYLLALQHEHPYLSHTSDFNRIVQTLTDTSIDVRQIAHNLLPGELLMKGLPQAVKDFCKDLFAPRHIHADIQVFGSWETVPIALSITLYRIVQELAHNIIKHAQATEVIVILGKEGDTLSLLVEDNGKGMPGRDTRKEHASIGLSGLEERVKAQNGTLSIETTPGSGTTIYITFTMPFDINEPFVADE